MSQSSLVHIPFTQGMNEGADPKMLPPGQWQLMRNRRIRKDGRNESRWGYRFQSGSPTTGVIASASPNRRAALTVRTRTAATAPATAYLQSDGGSNRAPQNIQNVVSEIEAPRRQALIRTGELVDSTASVDSVTTGDYLAYVYSDYNSGGNAIAAVIVIDINAGRRVFTQTLQSGARNIRLVLEGSNVAVYYVVGAGTAIKWLSINTSTFIVSGPTTVATAAGGLGPYFDVAEGTGSTALLVYPSSGVQLDFGSVSGGVYTLIATQATAATARPTICLDRSNHVALVWAEGATFQSGNLYYATWTTGGTPVIAKTSISTTGNVTGYPVVGKHPSVDWIAAWEETTAGAPNTGNLFTYASNAVLRYIPNVGLTSRPFIVNQGVYLWIVDKIINSPPSSTVVPVKGAYYMLDIGQNQNSGTTYTMPELVCCNFNAMPKVQGQTDYDSRRHGISAVTKYGLFGSGAMVALPVYVGNVFGIDSIRFDYGDFADRLRSAQLNGQVIFSGGRVQELNGTAFHETGLLDGPTITSTSTTAGTIPAGTYQYVAVWQYYDPNGRRHRSPPSLPVSVTLGGAFNIVVNVGCIPFTQKNNVTVELYRTSNAGTVFQRVAGGLSAFYNISSGNYVQYVDNMSDTTLASQEILYTQGARGGLSGLLANDQPPACRYVATGNNRILLGGLEDVTAVQWSKRIYPGEPIQFSADNGFRANVDGEVTAVHCMDGIWYIFTRTAIWAVSGDGPDDNGGGSTFSDPQRLPSEVGCIAHTSLLQVPKGLLFQAGYDRLYLLPRGSNAPVWYGQPIRSTMKNLGTCIVQATEMVAAENCAYLLIQNGATFTLAVLDTRIGQWCIDSIGLGVPRTMTQWDGALFISGAVLQTPDLYVDDVDGSHPAAIVGTLTTGDIRPFGLLGHGRTLHATILGEYLQGDYTLGVSVAYDSGFGIVAADTYSFSNTSGVSSREMWEVTLTQPKGESFQFTFTITPSFAGSDGLYLNGMTLDAVPGTGTPRLAAGSRA